MPADTQMTTFNPFLSYYDGELNVIGAIYPALTMLDDKGKPVPYLADSWTTSPDKLDLDLQDPPRAEVERRPAADRRRTRPGRST